MPITTMQFAKRRPRKQEQKPANTVTDTLVAHTGARFPAQRPTPYPAYAKPAGLRRFLSSCTMKGGRYRRDIVGILSFIVLAQAVIIVGGYCIFHRREARLLQETQRLRTVMNYSGMMLGLPESETLALRERGLKDPPVDIVCDLIENKGFILPKEYMGREIGFRFRNSVQILTSRWILADFDDGRLKGKVLLEFNIGDNGRIVWRIIDSYLERSNENSHSV